MTIVDPPIRDNSEFYKNKLYQDNNIVYNDCSTALCSKEESDTTVYNNYSDENIDLYSIKVKLFHGYCLFLKTNLVIKNVLSRRKKWFILMIVALQGFLGPLTSSIYVGMI